MNFRRIDADFAIAGQIQPDELRSVADAGFQAIICARPDDEEMGQPSFRQIAEEARKVGLTAVHIPVSGQLTEGALIRMEQALEDLPRPILGYCRSGARAGSLYGAIMRAAG
ncbi:MAG: TIGR01244 family phosphatase [Devosia nanyangense]|uniref:TIGR01244 family phosphatase n=1 Tax=Devosia nanyangense TaxID=1228055 RepID=A0A933L2D0_9HYPH|nr:TIGR01244 family phosphatase [Devosia nanyangense]